MVSTVYGKKINSTRPGALSIQPKIPKIPKRGQMVRKFPGKVSRKSGNCWISQNSGNSGWKFKWNGNSRKEISESLGIPREVVLFSGNYGKYCSVRHWEFPEIQTIIFHRIESAQGILSSQYGFETNEETRSAPANDRANLSVNWGFKEALSS